MSRRSATSERIFLARRMPRLHRSRRRRVLAEGVSAAAMAPALVPGLRAHGAAPAWPGKDNPVLSWCIPAGVLCSRVRWPGSPPLPRLGPGTTLRIPASGINSHRLLP